MKILLHLSLLIILLFSIDCHREEDEEIPVSLELRTCTGGNFDTTGLFFIGDETDGLNIQISNDININHNEIELYDFSTHIIYLKHDFRIIWRDTFSIRANFEEIYKGVTHPSYLNFLDFGPIIYVQPRLYCDDMICIDFCGLYDTAGNLTPDPRNDPRIIDALIKNDQYHIGLKGIIDTIVVINRIGDKSQVELSFTIVNDDNLNYYILDPYKMGIGLFHYFTNGLFLIYNVDNRHFSYSYKGEHETPTPWNLQSKNWLSVLEKGKSITFSLLLDEFDNVPQGQYKASFMFPGFHYVHKEDREQEHGRIWLGELMLSREITIK